LRFVFPLHCLLSDLQPFFRHDKSTHPRPALLSDGAFDYGYDGGVHTAKAVGNFSDINHDVEVSGHLKEPTTFRQLSLVNWYSDPGTMVTKLARFPALPLRADFVSGGLGETEKNAQKALFSAGVLLFRPQITGWGVTSDGLKFWQVRWNALTLGLPSAAG